MMARTTANLTIMTALVALAGMLVVSELVSWVANPTFSLWGMAVILLIAACILGSTTKVHGWAQMIGSGTSVRNGVKYLCYAIAACLLFRGTALLVLRATQPIAFDGQTFHVFSFTFSPKWLRSLIGSPIAEELFYRGWLLAWFDRQALPPLRFFRVQLSMAIVLTSLAFTVGHLLNNYGSITWMAAFSLCFVFVISLYLGMVRQKTGGLLIPMLCHALVNFMNAFLVFA